jgi:hypothetical protein
MKPGEPFNPYQLFHGLFVPEALARYTGLSPGAKLAYGRLARYAGQNGECYPAVPTLAREIGVGGRQARSYIAELESDGFIRRLARFKEGAQTSNEFQFLWHTIFDDAQSQEGRNDPSGGGRKSTAAGGRKDPAGEESHSEENHLENIRDLDCLLTNRQNRDSQAGCGSPSVCKQYLRLREALCEYMMSGPEDEKLYPSDRHVVDVMDAAGRASEEEVIACLKHFYSERGLKPGTRNGPRSFAWFATVVQDYFTKREERSEIANPTGFAEWEGRNAGPSLSREQFDELTDAF